MGKMNVAELLKDCPKGMELDCIIFEDVTFEKVIDASYPIKIITNDSAEFLTEYGCVSYIDSAKCVIFPKGKTTWEGFQRPFKDGDIIVDEQGNIAIYKQIHKSFDESYIDFYCGLAHLGKLFIIKNDEYQNWGKIKYIEFATEEEKQKLFDAIKANGYKWNPETKTLEKLIEPKFKVGDRIRHKTTNKNDIYEISKVYDDSYGLVDFTWMVYMKYQDDYELVPRKFDITTLKPFDKVLVRDYDTHRWVNSLYGYCDELYAHKHSCINGYRYIQCIPYEENKHLLGTTNYCDDYFKTWE